MRHALPVLLCGVLVAGSTPIFAAGADDRPLARAAALESTRPLAANAPPVPQRQAAGQRSWAGRHPALSGALVGTTSGAALGSLEDCNNTGAFGYCSRGASVAAGALLGAGIGSLTGFFIGLAKK